MSIRQRCQGVDCAQGAEGFCRQGVCCVLKRFRQLHMRQCRLNQLETLSRDGVESCAAGSSFQLASRHSFCPVGEKIRITVSTADAVTGLVHGHRLHKACQTAYGVSGSDDGCSYGQNATCLTSGVLPTCCAPAMTWMTLRGSFSRRESSFAWERGGVLTIYSLY